MLKPDLAQRLANADRSHQGQLGQALFWRGSKYVAAALLALFALDALLHLGAGWRASLSAAYLALAVALGAWAFYVAWVRRNSPEKTARLLESRDESLGSKLINFLQLRRELDGQPALTRLLGEQALTDYSARLEKADFKPLTKAPELPRDRRRAAWTLGLCAAALAVFFPISVLEVLRFADPFGDHPPYSHTRIEITEPAEDGAPVTYNGDLLIKAKTAGHTPDELYVSFHDPAKPREVRTVPMFSKGGIGFLQQIEGVKSDLLVSAHTKDGVSVSKQRLVRVALTPKLDKAFVTVSPPAYTGLKPKEATFSFKEVKALAGSEVKFRVRSNRPLAGGSIELQTENAPAAPVPMQPSAENEVSGAFSASESGRLKFSMVDVAQNVSQQSLSANLTVTHDLPPEISIEAPPNDSFVCEDFKVEARIAAADDYGLKTIRLHRALNEVFSAPKNVAFETVTTSATERAEFDIKDLGVRPGDVISFFAEAVDTCPEPHLARSKTVHLMVISVDEYNDALRERSDISDIAGKYSQLLNEFQDLVDEQKELRDKIKEQQDKNSPQELEKLLARQSELNQKLADMAKRMEKFVREKPLYDLESELQQALTQKAKEVRDSLEQSNEALKDIAAKAAESGAEQEKRLQALASLRKQADEQLAKLDQTQREAKDEVMPPIEDAALMNALINDMNHFKMLFEAQTAMTEQLKPMERKAEPSDTDKLALKQCAGTEKQMEQGLQKIIADLREHALAARQVFPKAAESARDMAAAMERADLSALAGRAAYPMLTGRGPDSYQSAEKLRQEMEKFFEDEPERSGAMCKEMDTRLKLRRNLTAKNTFQQMAQSRKFGFGQGMTGSGMQGQGGQNGYAASAGDNFGMLGGETFAGDPSRSGVGGNGQAKIAGTGQKMNFDKADVLSGVPSANRATGSVQTENQLEGYRDAIDAYFNTIAK
jgi:hypothetical protein